MDRTGAPGDKPKTLNVAFVLRPHFTLTPFAAIIDVLRLAADEGDRSRPINCRWTVLSRDLNPVAASCGVEVLPNAVYGDPAGFDYVIVVGGLLHRGPKSDDRTLEFLRAADRAGATLVGVCTGGFTLIRAGLMQGRRCCVSWYHHQDLIEQFPDVTPVADQLFVVDGRRITCAGGAGAVDLAAWMVEKHIGRASVQKALHILVVDRARPPNTPQPQPPVTRIVHNERVRRAMLLIEQNLSEPLNVDEIAGRVNISKRQLERVFREEVGMSLQEFSRTLRLHYGLWLLAHSDRTITDIAQECGFSDTSHFSRVFRDTFGRPPSALRQEGAAAIAALLKSRSWYGSGGPTEADAENLKGEKRPYL